jgi:hypothetical protein
MPDLVVVIPGILGSVLEREGKEVWGLSGQAMIDNLLSLGRNIQYLPFRGVLATRNQTMASAPQV